MLVLPNDLPQLLQQYFASSRTPSSVPQESSSSSLSRSLGAYEARDDFDAYAMMAPQYAYGRHRGPSPKQTLKAAVMIAVLKNEHNDWFIPLTLRPAQMQEHAGQVSLPGGRAERGEDANSTAVREFEEEIGWSSHNLISLGSLTSIYVYASRYRVKPVVSISEYLPKFAPNPDEVAELLQFPLSQLLSPNSVDVGVLQRGTMQFKAPGYWIGEHFVWGATAMILTEFRSLLFKALSPDTL